jgi:hypothetical protein
MYHDNMKVKLRFVVLKSTLWKSLFANVANFYFTDIENVKSCVMFKILEVLTFRW